MFGRNIAIGAAGMPAPMSALYARSPVLGGMITTGEGDDISDEDRMAMLRHAGLAGSPVANPQEPALPQLGAPPLSGPSTRSIEAGMPESWRDPFGMDGKVGPYENVVEVPGGARPAANHPGGSIMFKDTKGGDWKDFHAGDRFEGKRSIEAYDPTEGRVKPIKPLAEGGSFSPSPSLDDVAFKPESYYQDKARDIELGTREAYQRGATASAGREEALTRAIEQDPLAIERGRAKLVSDIRRGEESERARAYADPAEKLEAWRQQQYDGLESLPEAEREKTRRKIDDFYESRMAILKGASGFGTRLGQAVR